VESARKLAFASSSLASFEAVQMPKSHIPWCRGERGEWLAAGQLALVMLVVFGPSTLAARNGRWARRSGCAFVALASWSVVSCWGLRHSGTCVLRKAPKGFGSQPQKYRNDVIYLKEPLTASEALKSVTTKPGVDEAFVGAARWTVARR
jgi:hypothetical protein